MSMTFSRGSNYPVRLLCALALFLIFSIPALSDESDGCTCTEAEKLAYLRDAETLFTGMVARASIVNRDDPVLFLSVDVRQPLRGRQSGVVDLRTPMPDQCGLPAWIGAHYVFAFNSTYEPVTQCSGSGNWQYKGSYFLEYALITVAFIDADKSLIERQFQRGIRAGAERKYLDIYFELLHELDPMAPMVINNNEVRYRQLVFKFDNDKLSRYYWD